MIQDLVEVQLDDLRHHRHVLFAPNFPRRLESRKSCWTFSANNGLFALLSTKNNFTTTRSFLVIVD
jgi:hypothetical protein